MATKQNTIGLAHGLYMLMEAVAEEFDRDMSVAQLMTFLRAGMAGAEGVDQGTLEKAVGASPSGMSRTVRRFGAVSYDKTTEGYGVLDFELDPTDNRKRVIKINPRGEEVIRRLASKIK